MSHSTSVPAHPRPAATEVPAVFPIDQHSHVAYRLERLTADASAERVAAARRAAHRAEPRLHRRLHLARLVGAVRGRVGRLVIGLGVAIAGSAPEADVRHAA